MLKNSNSNSKINSNKIKNNSFTKLKYFITNTNTNNPTITNTNTTNNTINSSSNNSHDDCMICNKNIVIDPFLLKNLNSLNTNISLNSLNQLLSPIISIISKLLSFTSCQNCGHHKIIAFIGQTGSGKSTLINFLNNHTLNSNNKNILYCKNPIKGSETADGNKAITFFPNFYRSTIDNIIYCDFPGFFDTRGPIHELFIHLFHKTLLERRSFKFVIVQSYAAHQGSREYNQKFIDLLSCDFINSENSLVVLTRSDDFTPTTLLDLTDNQIKKKIQVLHMPKPTIPNSIYDPFKGKLKKDLLKSMKSLKSPMVEFDVPFTSNVKLYLLDAQAFLLDLIAQELDPIIESGLLQLQIQPYDFTYFKAVFSDKVYSLSDLLAVLQACRLIGQVSPYLAQLESYFTLIEGLINIKTTKDMKSWTTSKGRDIITNFLRLKMDSYELPRYPPLKGKLVDKIDKWIKLTKTHYLEYASYQRRLLDLILINDISIIYEIKRLCEFRMNCCFELSQVWVPIANELTLALGDTKGSSQFNNFVNVTELKTAVEMIRSGLTALLTPNGNVHASSAALVSVSTALAGQQPVLIGMGAALLLAISLSAYLDYHASSIPKRSVQAIHFDLELFMAENQLWVNILASIQPLFDTPSSIDKVINDIKSHVHEFNRAFHTYTESTLTNVTIILQKLEDQELKGTYFGDWKKRVLQTQLMFTTLESEMQERGRTQFGCEMHEHVLDTSVLWSGTFDCCHGWVWVRHGLYCTVCLKRCHHECRVGFVAVPCKNRMIG